jgi:hypothetical protein
LDLRRRKREVLRRKERGRGTVVVVVRIVEVRDDTVFMSKLGMAWSEVCVCEMVIG